MCGPKQAFSEVLYQSLDFELVILYILWFYFIDLVTSNPMLAIFVVYLLERSLRFFREWLGKSNLAKKSMLDKKFLM